jgi:raffinose/stachyose/melibiose transport system substrate-binding protein
MMHAQLIRQCRTGFIALAGVIGLLAAARLDGQAIAKKTEDRGILRFAHWQLEPGIREALDALAVEYMRRHPGVRIEQLPIPERIYASWMRTQLVAGTAPDLIQLGIGSNEEVYATYFEPLTAAVAGPNPYNQGTDLEGIPWRDTFVDGLNTFSYSPGLMQNMSVPLATFTVRLLYNQQLWREFLGDTPAPRTFEELLDICERFRAATNRAGRPALPIVGFRQYASSATLDRPFAQQTKRLMTSFSAFGHLKTPGASHSFEEVALAYLRGQWDFSNPAVLAGLAAMRDLGLQFQPGFSRANREEALFQFVQGRALMIPAGSWDYPGIRSQAGFPLGVFRLMPPSPGHSQYGAGPRGPESEAGLSARFPFGLVSGSAQPGLAIDFLRFVTSRPGSELFVKTSQWLPSIVDADIPETLQPFATEVGGYPDGFSLCPANDWTNTVRVFWAHLHLLVDRHRMVADYVAAMKDDYPAALRDDLVKRGRQNRQIISRQDTALAAYRRLEQLSTEEAAASVNARRLSEGQTALEANVYWVEHELNRSTAPH